MFGSMSLSSNQISNFFIGCLFSQIIIIPLASGSISYSFERRINEFEGNFQRGSALDCVAQCSQLAECTCVRLAINESGICEPMLAEMDANGLNHSNYVYYSMISPDYSESNIAHKKPATQSSVFQVNGISYTADRAVDGNPNIETFSLPYLSQTKDGKEADIYPWWQVDLKREYLISLVKVLNRKNPADRLHDFEIRVGNKPISAEFNNAHYTSNGLCAFHQGGGIGPGEMVDFKCEPCPLKGRFLTIQVIKFCEDCREKDRNILNLAEVEVYGSPITVEKKKEETKDATKKSSSNSNEESDDY